MRSPRVSKVTKTPGLSASPPSSRTRLQRQKSRLVGSELAETSLQAATNFAGLQVKSLECDGMDVYPQTRRVRDSSSGMADRSFAGRNNGKSRMVEADDEEQPFPFLDLPAELRLQIYRVCLTRDYNIKLSKAQKPNRNSGQKDSCSVEAVELSDGIHASSTTSVSYVDAASPASSPEILSSSPHSTAESAEASDQDEDNADGLPVALLRTCKQIYKEARDVLYSENAFDIDIFTAVNSLAALHQRSRRYIQHIELVIPNYTEILENFSEIVRLALRYCAGLKTFVIHTPFDLPGSPDGNMSSCNSTVYANGFDILRWLPQQCEVVLDLGRNPEIDAVVAKHLVLAKRQDKVAYARRQLISNEGTSSTPEHHRR